MELKEVEVKVKISDPKNTIALLNAKGVTISEPVFQEDVVFINFPETIPYAEYPQDAVFLRIRKQNGKILLTAKQNAPDATREDLSKIEKELEVSDGLVMEEIILMAGFRKAVEIKKKRVIAKVGLYEICVDEVEGLGCFMEIEKKTSEETTKVVLELFDFLKKEFGVAEEDRIYKGYDVLIAKQMGI
jgi:adenylate cyclase class 2